MKTNRIEKVVGTFLQTETKITILIINHFKGVVSEYGEKNLKGLSLSYKLNKNIINLTHCHYLRLSLKSLPVHIKKRIIFHKQK